MAERTACSELVSGARSLICRETFRNQTLLAASDPRFSSLDAVMATYSLCQGTGNFDITSRDSSSLN